MSRSLHRAGTREIEKARKRVKHMRQREIVAFEARAVRIQKAIDELAEAVMHLRLSKTTVFVEPEPVYHNRDGYVEAYLGIPVLRAPYFDVSPGPGNRFNHVILVRDLRQLAIPAARTGLSSIQKHTIWLPPANGRIVEYVALTAVQVATVYTGRETYVLIRQMKQQAAIHRSLREVKDANA